MILRFDFSETLTTTVPPRFLKSVFQGKTPLVQSIPKLIRLTAKYNIQNENVPFVVRPSKLVVRITVHAK